MNDKTMAVCALILAALAVLATVKVDDPRVAYFESLSSQDLEVISVDSVQKFSKTSYEDPCTTIYTYLVTVKLRNKSDKIVDGILVVEANVMSRSGAKLQIDSKTVYVKVPPLSVEEVSVEMIGVGEPGRLTIFNAHLGLNGSLSEVAKVSLIELLLIKAGIFKTPIRMEARELDEELLEFAHPS